MARTFLDVLFIGITFCGLLSTFGSIYILRIRDIYDEIIALWIRLMCLFDLIILVAMAIRMGFFLTGYSLTFCYVAEFVQNYGYFVAILMRAFYCGLRTCMLMYPSEEKYFNMTRNSLLASVVVNLGFPLAINDILNPKNGCFSSEVTRSLVILFRVIVIIIADIVIVTSSLYLIYFLQTRVKPLLKRINMLKKFDVIVHMVVDSDKHDDFYENTRITIIANAVIGIVWVICNCPFVILNILHLLCMASYVDNCYYDYNDHVSVLVFFPICCNWIFTIILCEPTRQ